MGAGDGRGCAIVLYVGANFVASYSGAAKGCGYKGSSYRRNAHRQGPRGVNLLRRGYCHLRPWVF